MTKKEYHSDISGFYKLSVEERMDYLASMVDFTDEEKKVVKEFGYFTPEQMDLLVENVIASFQMPLGIACNFKINDKDYLVPMVTEEPSVIAAASNSAGMARPHGGFHSEKVEPVMIGQVQLLHIPDVKGSIEKIKENKDNLIKIANEKDPILVKLGGGAIDLEVRELDTIRGPMIIVHLLVNTLDAMGANAVNTMAEAIAPHLRELCDCESGLRIISNLAVNRLARCKATFDKDMLGGPEVVEGILDAYAFAKADPYRAATHNKGIMNGIIALTAATGNDTRAIEAGAHVYASMDGYSPLSSYEKDGDGNLVGRLELPMALGIIGGMTKTHPVARIALKILRVDNAQELAQVAVALGLAQNLAALRALAKEGIQAGHMRLHKRKVASHES